MSEAARQTRTVEPVRADHIAAPERPRSRTVSMCMACDRLLVWVVDDDRWEHVDLRH